MVVTEAMACGLVPVASEHTCAPDVITEGRDGFVIPIRDPEAIVQRLTACHQNEERRFEMARNAVATARNMTWDAYADQVATRSQGWS
jgi:glycosyltransferase involved in cell wall biosynthesis